MPKVYIINNSGHDYSPAEQYGELVFLSSGKVHPYESNTHYRDFAEKMKDATSEDFILITSLASMNAIAGWILGTLNLPLQMLIFKDGEYVVRKLMPTLLT